MTPDRALYQLAAEKLLQELFSPLAGPAREAVVADMARGEEFRAYVRASVAAYLETSQPSRGMTPAADFVPTERTNIIYLDRGGEVLVRLREESST